MLPPQFLYLPCNSTDNETLPSCFNLTRKNYIVFFSIYQTKIYTNWMNGYNVLIELIIYLKCSVVA